jgi:chemotaxis family two-component system sensor kinase Cph1
VRSSAPPPGPYSVVRSTTSLARRYAGRSLRASDLALQNPLLMEIGGRSFDGVLHRNGKAVILELEGQAEPSAPVDRLLRDAFTQLQRAATVDSLCTAAAKQIRMLTGFDRVMVYQFHRDGHGEVVAEDKDPALEALLGLHYPASDIPRQARQLYVINPVRVIPDATYAPVSLLATANGAVQAPLDLTFASLRGVSPIHLEYLANMGVHASMSVSLVRGGELWGLLACHHRHPRLVPFAIRSACEVIGRLVSLEIGALQELEKGRHRSALRGSESVLVEAMRGAPEGWSPGLYGHAEILLRIVNATGAALVDENGTRTTGETPLPSEIAAIVGWLDGGRSGAFATHVLGTELPSAVAYQSVASGLLAVRTSRPHPGYILWFRPEVLRTVTWGGDPSKTGVPSAMDGKIHPRNSFAAWKEIVRGSSSPWSAAEIEIAEDVARRAVEVDLEKQIVRAEQAIRTRDDVVAIVSHDLKNPLNVIQMASQAARGQLETHQSTMTLDRIDRATGRISALITDLLDLAKIEAGRFHVEASACSVRSLITDTITLLQPMAEKRGVRLAHDGVDDNLVSGEHDRLLQVLGNLVGNAIKFSSSGGRIELSARTRGADIRFVVRDEGPGISANVLAHVFDRYWQSPGAGSRDGSGLGLYIAEGLVEAHGGRIWAESVVGSGATFFFTIPAAPSS